MRKTYETPAVVSNGSVVQATRNGGLGDVEPAGKRISTGSVGYNL